MCNCEFIEFKVVGVKNIILLKMWKFKICLINNICITSDLYLLTISKVNLFYFNWDYFKIFNLFTCIAQYLWIKLSNNYHNPFIYLRFLLIILFLIRLKINKTVNKKQSLLLFNKQQCFLSSYNFNFDNSNLVKIFLFQIKEKIIIIIFRS